MPYAQSCPSLWDPHGLWPTRFLCPQNFPGKNTEAGCHFLLQGISPTQESSPCFLCLLPCSMILYRWAIYSQFSWIRKWISLVECSLPLLYFAPQTESRFKTVHQIHSRLRNNTVQFFLLLNKKTDLFREDATCFVLAHKKSGWLLSSMTPSQSFLTAQCCPEWRSTEGWIHMQVPAGISVGLHFKR